MDSSVPSFKKKIRVKRPKVSFGIEGTEIEDLIGSIEKAESSSFEILILSITKLISVCAERGRSNYSASYLTLTWKKRENGRSMVGNEGSVVGKDGGKVSWSWFYDRRCEAWLNALSEL